MNQKTGRREFVATVTKAVGGSVLLPSSSRSVADCRWSDQQAFTVEQVMQLMLKTIPGAPFPKTVDTLKSGNPSQTVTGIVTAMFATVDVIEQAIAVGANFIIVHEPTFYNHADETDWLKNDPVFQHKYNLLKKHRIAVWRFHDYWHSHQPDGIQTGMLQVLDWSKYTVDTNLEILKLPTTPLNQLIAHVKEKLAIKQVRLIGDLAQSCQRVLFLPGAPGGRNQISAIEKVKPDVVLCGEVSEWETPEYVRDARRQGQKLSLVVLGHIMSEASGMNWLVSWLQPKVPAIKVQYIYSGNPFTYV